MRNPKWGRKSEAPRFRAFVCLEVSLLFAKPPLVIPGGSAAGKEGSPSSECDVYKRDQRALPRKQRAIGLRVREQGLVLYYPARLPPNPGVRLVNCSRYMVLGSPRLNGAVLVVTHFMFDVVRVEESMLKVPSVFIVPSGVPRSSLMVLMPGDSGLPERSN